MKIAWVNILLFLSEHAPYFKYCKYIQVPSKKMS